MFRSVKLKLTAWYLVIIMFVTLSFSGFVYLSVVKITQTALLSQRVRLERRIREFGMIPVPMIRQQLINDEEAFYEIRKKTLSILILVNLGVLVSSSLLGYVLSGLTLAPIEDMVKKQKRFISDAAHELKTPLTAMKTDLEVTLRDKSLSKEAALVSLKDTITEIDKLNSFISGLLSKSKYQNGILKMEPVNLASVINKVIANLHSLAESKNIQFKTDLSDGWIIGNIQSLEELFRNLIDNAIKYNKNGGVVEITLLAGDKEIITKISDQGIGISTEDLKNIFEPFFRADMSRTKENYDGFGLGLSIAKDAVEKHEGKIEVESQKDQGTTFIVTFKKISGI
jgi:signal transduction histidine kinase